MPKLEVRKANEVPSPSRVSRAVRQRQETYENFIREIEGNVGELDLAPGEVARGVKVRLRRAATSLGTQIDIWDTNGKVYFKQASRRRGRPRSSG